MGGVATGIVWIEAGLPAPYRLVFSKRGGGVSEAPYDSLNLGFHIGDEPGRVLANRGLLASSLDVGLERWTLVRQVHSSRVAEVGPGDAGAGSLDHGSGLADADAMISDHPRAALCVLTADCVPVAIYGTAVRAMALVHSGWKGTLDGIAGAALRALSEKAGVEPAEAGVVLGPGIGKCCYEVDGERAAFFRKKFGVEAAEENRLDLYRAIRETLLDEGVREEMIAETGPCTCCDPSFYSYRRDGVTGRQAALLWMQGPNGEKP